MRRAALRPGLGRLSCSAMGTHRWPLFAVPLFVTAFGLSACKSGSRDGCARLYDQLRQCQSVHQPRKQFVERCRQAQKKPQAAHLRDQLRCAIKPSCRAFRICLQRAHQKRQPGDGRGQAPGLYRNLRSGPRPSGMR